MGFSNELSQHKKSNLKLSIKDVIIQGLSSEGGLYVPEEIPLFP